MWLLAAWVDHAMFVDRDNPKMNLNIFENLLNKDRQTAKK
jgi:hypothetical protein